MTNAKKQELTLKISQVASLLTGVSFTTYNLFSFKVSKGANYFADSNQIWLAFGVTVLAVFYILKNWKKM